MVICTIHAAIVACNFHQLPGSDKETSVATGHPTAMSTYTIKLLTQD